MTQPPSGPTAPGADTRGPDELLGIARGPEGRLDLRGVDVATTLTKGGHTLRSLGKRKIENVVFGDRDWDRPPAELANLSFEGASLDDVSFVNTRLTGVYFRGCTFKACDFRYAHITATSFQDATFEGCDFYRAYFSSANIFTAATFEGVSLDKAWLDGIMGLTKSVFERDKPAMPQEYDREAYEEFLEATKKDRPPQHSIERALEEAPRDAAEVYRSLSGMWTAQGQLDAASFAYVKCKTLERRFLCPCRTRRVNRDRKGRNRTRAELKEQSSDELDSLDPDQQALAKSPDEPMLDYGPRKLGAWVSLWIAGIVANFGQSWGRVAAWLLVLNLVPGIVYSVSGGVERVSSSAPVYGLFQCWLFSLEQMTSSSGHHLTSTNDLVDLIGSLQTVMGVTLLGLLGFALANRLRNA